VPAPPGDAGGPSDELLRAELLGPFCISFGGKKASWTRPPAKRLCELVLLSPGRRIAKEAVCEALFPGLAPPAASKELSRALSMARASLAALGGTARGLMRSDRALIWADPGTPMEVDLELHEALLRSAFKAGPGPGRDQELAEALAFEGALLEDEPFAEWAMHRRDQLEVARQEARLALARERDRMTGPLGPDASAGTAVEAWESCLEHDPACEEAAAALMRAYSARGQRHLVVRTYDRCRAALEDLGLRATPALDQLLAAATAEGAPPRPCGAVPSALPGAESLPPHREERRTVTVLFAEVATTVKARGADPEDVRSAVGEVLARVITEVEGLGGVVTSVSGRGLEALFGAPEAHEDDPERAVRAAFRSLSAGAAGSGAYEPAIRIGIETGPAVVGPLRARPKSGYGAMGAVVGEAAAVQSFAKPGSTLVGPATRKATEGIFTWGPTEEVVLASDTKPLVATYLERPAPRARARPLRLGGRGPLVGRAGEVSVLDAALRGAAGGRGSVVVLVGEPGLGKTRLVQECRKRFMAWVGAGSGRLPLWLEGRCASYASTTPYGLYQHLLASWLGMTTDEDEEAMVAALDRALTVSMGAPDLRPVLAHMMGIPAGADVLRMSPPERQRATFNAMRSLVSRLASIGPTVVALEDLHWVDPTSLALTEELSSVTAQRPLLVVLTRRPEPDPGVTAFEALLEARLGPQLHVVELAPLSLEAERELGMSLVGTDAERGVLESVLSGAEGNPLVLEERLFAMLEGGGLVREEGAWRLGPAVGAEVPAVLERVVRSRVDRLSPATQEALLTASVFGPEVPLSYLTAASEAGADLQDAMAELSSRGLVQEVASGPEPRFRFRHALIQEATYQGLLRGERRRRHARAAAAIEAAWAGRLEEVAAVLARHLAAAGEVARAVGYFEAAGDHAAAAYANSEAVSSFRSALELRRQDHVGLDLATAEAALRAKLAEVYWRTAWRAEAREEFQEAIRLLGRGDAAQRAYLWIRLGRLETADYCHDAAAAAFDAADELLGERPWEQGEAMADRWLELMLEGRAKLYLTSGQSDRALAALDAVQSVLEAQGGAARQAFYYEYRAGLRVRQNRYRVDEEAIALLRRAVAAAGQAGDEDDMGWRTGALGWSLVLFRRSNEGQEVLEGTLARAERVGDAHLRGRCLMALTVAAVRRHDVEALRSLAPRALGDCEANAYGTEAAVCKASLAWLAWQDGRPDDVVTLATEATELYRTGPGPFSYMKWMGLFPLIAVHLAAGQVNKAAAAAREMLDPAQLWLPDDLWSALKAACKAWDNNEPEAADCKLAEALELAHDLHYF
jgi:class 3 adenylate cyclase/tetratricopeptide (TPR) repeat protein